MVNSETKNSVIFFVTVILAGCYACILSSVVFGIIDGMEQKQRISIGVCLSLLVLFVTAFLAALTHDKIWKKYNRENYDEYHAD